MTAKVISYIKQSIDGVDVHAFTVEDDRSLVRLMERA